VEVVMERWLKGWATIVVLSVVYSCGAFVNRAIEYRSMETAKNLFWVFGSDITDTPIPHDCDYQTAPLGKKWCHYEGTAEKEDTVTTDSYGGDKHEKHAYKYTIYWNRVGE
jgi:hypothetical protein